MMKGVLDGVSRAGFVFKVVTEGGCDSRISGQGCTDKILPAAANEPYTLRTTTYTLHPKPYTLNPKP